MKLIKYISLFLLTAIIVMVGYIYSLTFTSEGRLDWGQALFLKMIGKQDGQIERIKKMTVLERSHLSDGIPIDLTGFSVDTLRITADSLETYIFKPQNFTKNSPVVIYYHGGAFVLPWDNHCVSYATRLSNLFNAVVVGVDYRVAPEHPFPIPNNDCFATFLWTIENINKWGGNPNQIIMAGESAGATLAATVAIKAQKQHLTNIKYQILECPSTYIPDNTEAYKKFKYGYFLEKSIMDYALGCYLPNKTDHTNPLALPFYADSLSNLPPAFIATCEFDPIKDTGRDYAEKLKNAKVPTTYIELEGLIHCIPGPFNESDRVSLYKKVADEAKKYINK